MAKNYKSLHMNLEGELYDKVMQFAKEENRTIKNAVETILIKHFKN
jgi:hypothetical protein